MTRLRHSADCQTSINKVTSLAIAWPPSATQCEAGVGETLQAWQMAGLAWWRVLATGHPMRLACEHAAPQAAVKSIKSQDWDQVRCIGRRGRRRVHGGAHAYAMPISSINAASDHHTQRDNPQALPPVPHTME